MKNFLKRLPKKAYVAVATLALLAGIASSAMAGFGPDRTTRQWTSAENGFDYVTFNSYTGVPNGIGDERNFMRGVQVGRDSVWSDPVTGVTQDAEVEVKMYVHNDADPLLNDRPGNPGVAKNVTVRAALPTGSAQAQQLTGYISADNAQPKQIFDTLDMTGANNGNFELSYVAGSAKMFNHENGQTTALADTIATTGVNIGDQKGCFKYLREVTFRVKVKMPSWSTQKVARMNGEAPDKYRKAVNAEAGDLIDYRIWFKNAGTTQLNNVVVTDDLPAFTTVVPGSVKMYNNNFPSPTGHTFGPGAVQNNGKQINVEIGSYAAGTDAYVTYTLEIQKAEELTCGVHQLLNVVTVTPKGFGAASDKAYVNIINESDCEDTEPSYICESLTVEKLGGRKIKATVKAPASNGAELKSVTFNYGDGSTAKVTDKLVDEYEYKADGTYKVTATTTFTVNGEDKIVNGEACTAMVTFDNVPDELPSTGAGSLIGLVAATSVAGGVAHSVVNRRRNG